MSADACGSPECCFNFCILTAQNVLLAIKLSVSIHLLYIILRDLLFTSQSCYVLLLTVWIFMTATRKHFHCTLKILLFIILQQD